MKSKKYYLDQPRILNVRFNNKYDDNLNSFLRRKRGHYLLVLSINFNDKFSDQFEFVQFFSKKIS